MKAIFRSGVGLITAAALGLTPVHASAQAKDHDPVVYNLLLDCAALQVLFAQAADKETDKESATNSAVGFISAADSLSGIEITDYAAALDPRKTKILAMLDKKDPGVSRLVRSCAAIERVGRDAAAVAKK